MDPTLREVFSAAIQLSSREIANMLSIIAAVGEAGHKLIARVTIPRKAEPCKLPHGGDALGRGLQLPVRVPRLARSRSNDSTCYDTPWVALGCHYSSKRRAYSLLYCSALILS